MQRDDPVKRVQAKLAFEQPHFGPLRAVPELAVQVAAVPRVARSRRSERVLVLDDCMTNGATLSGPAPFRFLFWLTGSGPGLVRSKLWFFAFCKDKPAFVKSVLDEWDRLGPTKIAFLHGDEAGSDRIGEARAQLAAVIG
mgnify:CR=1 FL=1